MKRTLDEANDRRLRKGIKKFYPILFWYFCVKCQNQFRFEYGFLKKSWVCLREYGITIAPGFWEEECVCCKCLKNHDEAFEYWKNKEAAQ